ncbi:Predicted arabinose efflux permease, MFS family [Polaromonas sp. OV174]|uniref:YbfB/YjiJ family MFS transporter n=1 Tax=Polaromonas sp. OV174 TaxID=1855300 RepID=UPI0008EE2744|nr:YbfB/YjiJ family MFS transporter [Polaromonas sp. OV174]SFB85277.1 Predicted arabinose efflux permease, MFS family [Polaromonas sp. OV174]
MSPPVISRRQGLGAALGLALSPLVALGFTRFAYALLLPPMQTEFAWSFMKAGALNTSNAIGYLAGALLAAWLGKRFGQLQAFTWAMIASALALMATAWPSSFALLLTVRAAGGLATAVAFVLGSSLAASAMPGRTATAMSIYFAGSGLGVVLAGTFIPLAQAEGGALDWRLSWLLMGAVSLVASALAWLAARHSIRQTPARPAGPAMPVWGALGPSLLANLFYGAGYVGYMTFMIALLKQQGFGATLTMVFFALIGGASLLASLCWGRVLGRLKGGRGFALVCSLVALGTVPALIWPTAGTVIASALIFGASFMAGPAAVSVVAQRVLPAASLTWGLALLTATFSIGQSMGPLLGGWISDITGSLSAGLWLGPLLLLLGAALSWQQGPAAPKP